MTPRGLRSLSALGIPLVAALAITTSADAGQMMATKYPVQITGEQTEGKHEISTVAGTVKCNTATFTGSLTEASSELLITPAYSGCTLAGVGASVETTNCFFRTTLTTPTGGFIPVDTHLECPAGSTGIHFKVTGSTCEVTIDPQTAITEMKTTNFTNGTITDTIWSGFKYTVVNGSKCPNKPASGEYTNGSYKGTAQFTGHAPGEPGNSILITGE
jgi:hypothetical protein